MNTPAKYALRQRQSGVTLIELMIAMVLSLIVLIGVVNIYIVNKKVSRMEDGLSRMQENGRFAMDFLARDLRMAGYPNLPTLTDIDAIGDTSGIEDAGENNSDTLILSHGRTGIYITDDCKGDAIDPTATNTYDIQDTGRVNNRGNSIFSLYCNGTELVEGVENMQVLYGVRNTLDMAVANPTTSYLTSTQVAAAGAWNRIRSVRIALLVNMMDDLASRVDNNTYTLLGQSYPPAAADQQMRRVYTTMVVLRNRLY